MALSGNRENWETALPHIIFFNQLHFQKNQLEADFQVIDLQQERATLFEGGLISDLYKFSGPVKICKPCYF